MRKAFAITAGIFVCAFLPPSGALAQAQGTGQTDQGGMKGGGMMGGQMGGGGMMGGHMMSGEMMAMKSKQMAAMADMMKSMGEAMETQAQSMKGNETKAHRDAMMRIAKDAKSSASAMKRMSSEMGKLQGMGTMQMASPAAEMMGRCMASEKQAAEMMQKETEGGAAH
jgi:hypothetical protein